VIRNSKTSYCYNLFLLILIFLVFQKKKKKLFTMKYFLGQKFIHLLIITKISSPSPLDFRSVA
jgi:hypothetical protein